MLLQSTDGEDDSELSGGLIGKSFGDYEILEEINRGGMGVVFKARQIGLNRIVALKLMQGGVLASQKAAARFQREAEAVAKLDHPHVIPIYEIGEAAGHCFFSMKYVEGGTLGDSVGKFVGKPELAAKLMIKLSRAVQFAHEQGVLHRDIKPQNILLDAVDEPFITDFGLAKSDSEDAQITVSGEVFGSPSFMAPEQASGQHRAVGRRTDVYGLGAVLYHLLTGTPPFNGKTSFEVMKQVVEQRPLNPRQLDSSLPGELVAICLKCLKKDPETRYGSAEGLADDLEKWLEMRAQGGGLSLETDKGRYRGAWLVAVCVLGIASALLYLRAPDSDEGNVSEIAAPVSGTNRMATEPVMATGEVTRVDGLAKVPAIGSPISTNQFRALIARGFDLQLRGEDPSGNDILRGIDPDSGLPLEIRERRTGMHFVLIRPGNFVKGEPYPDRVEGAELRQMEKPFYLGKYEVTIDEFRVFAKSENFRTGQEEDGEAMYYPFPGGEKKNAKFSWQRLRWKHSGRHPLSLIRPPDVQEFLTWMNAGSVDGFDLPRDSEWEFAARGGQGSPYSWASREPDSDNKANLQDVTYYAAAKKDTGRRPGAQSHGYGKNRNDGHPYTAPVGSYPPNPLGLYDIVGNVREMIQLSGDRWAYRGWCFNTGGNGTPLLKRYMHDPVESSFMLGCRLIWRLPRSAPKVEPKTAMMTNSAAVVGVSSTNEVQMRTRYPILTRGYTKPIPGQMHPQLPTRGRRPDFFPMKWADSESMKALADKYAADHPTHFRSTIERYEQVWVATPPGSVRDAVLARIKDLLVKMERAAEPERVRLASEMNTLVDAGDFRAAYLVWARLSPELRTFKGDWTVYELIEGQVPMAHRRPVQPGELEMPPASSPTDSKKQL